MGNSEKLEGSDRPNLKDIDSLIRMNERALQAYSDLFSSKVSEKEFISIILGFNLCFETNFIAWKLIREALAE
jgi:hypothetical protein